MNHKDIFTIPSEQNSPINDKDLENAMKIEERVTITIGQLRETIRRIIKRN